MVKKYSNKKTKKYSNKKTKKYNNKKYKKSIKKQMKKSNKCNVGLLGVQEDIYTLGTCNKINGGSINIPKPYDVYAPVSGVAQSIPNGLVGSPINQTTGLPGVNGINGDNNYYSLNKYTTDISRAMMPSDDLRGGRIHKKRNTKKNKKRKYMRGGGAVQEFQNLLRGTLYNLGSVSNTITGYPAPVNPSPIVQNLNSNTNPNPNQNI
jgi:hypothetical protein